jgi:hypothetical protein
MKQYLYIHIYLFKKHYYKNWRGVSGGVSGRLGERIGFTGA